VAEGTRLLSEYGEAISIAGSNPALSAGGGLHCSAALAPVAQLDRASVYGTEGQRFESSRARSVSRKIVCICRGFVSDAPIPYFVARKLVSDSGRFSGALFGAPRGRWTQSMSARHVRRRAGRGGGPAGIARQLAKSTTRSIRRLWIFSAQARLSVCESTSPTAARSQARISGPCNGPRSGVTGVRRKASWVRSKGFAA
jgi:hypothetical protein